MVAATLVQFPKPYIADPDDRWDENAAFIARAVRCPAFAGTRSIACALCWRERITMTPMVAGLANDVANNVPGYRWTFVESDHVEGIGEQAFSDTGRRWWTISNWLRIRRLRVRLLSAALQLKGPSASVRRAFFVVIQQRFTATPPRLTI
ncbi:hypothetical protein ACWDRB_51210 [Nonomuraea sp. NPDC003707]